jgi:hypothetical protein
MKVGAKELTRLMIEDFEAGMAEKSKAGARPTAVAIMGIVIAALEVGECVEACDDDKGPQALAKLCAALDQLKALIILEVMVNVQAKEEAAAAGPAAAGPAAAGPAAAGKETLQ